MNLLKEFKKRIVLVFFLVHWFAVDLYVIMAFNLSNLGYAISSASSLIIGFLFKFLNWIFSFRIPYFFTLNFSFQKDTTFFKDIISNLFSFFCLIFSNFLLSLSSFFKKFRFSDRFKGFSYYKINFYLYEVDPYETFRKNLSEKKILYVFKFSFFNKILFKFQTLLKRFSDILAFKNESFPDFINSLKPGLNENLWKAFLKFRKRFVKFTNSRMFTEQEVLLFEDFDRRYLEKLRLEILFLDSKFGFESKLIVKLNKFILPFQDKISKIKFYIYPRIVYRPKLNLPKYSKTSFKLLYFVLQKKTFFFKKDRFSFLFYISLIINRWIRWKSINFPISAKFNVYFFKIDFRFKIKDIKFNLDKIEDFFVYVFKSSPFFTAWFVFFHILGLFVVIIYILCEIIFLSLFFLLFIICFIYHIFSELFRYLFKRPRK